MKKTLLIVFLFTSLQTFGQLTDDFSDADFTGNPVWTPDNAANWTTTPDNQLRSNSGTASSSFYITTPSTRAINAEWGFFINLQFNTSSANYVDVYLTSEQANLGSLTNNGYFVRIGGTPDEISLYKVTSGVSTILINGTDGVTNSSNTTLRIKVIRDAANNWTLERDAEGGRTFINEGTAIDNSFTTSGFFGIKIQQSTSSFFNKHFFDDIYAGDIGFDNVPPVLQSIEVINQTTLSLSFSEAVEMTSTQAISNYTVNNSIQNPLAALLLSDSKSVQLTFQKPFSNGTDYLIAVKAIHDLAGNSLSDTEKAFRYFIVVPVNPKDILITEIMADPTPVVQLPEAEYIEIYNKSTNPFDLAGWTLSDATTIATLPSVLLLPNSFLILTSASNVSKFPADVKVLAVISFPSLNNDGESLVLKNGTSQMIDSVNYHSDWYRDDEKKDGGWSLELIDPLNTCGEEENWIASDDEKGGTPGKSNSVLASKPDLTGPKLEFINPLQPDQLFVRFDEKMLKSISLSSFLFSPEVKLEKAFFTDLSLRQIQVNLTSALLARQLYTIHLVNLYDCNGNAIQEEYSRLSFALPEPADSLDLLVNEILFNPRTGGVDFVEVYNHSPRFINLKNAKLANYEMDQTKNEEIITTVDFLIAPGEYIVLTEDVSILKNQYPQSDGKKIFKTNLPGLPDDEGSIVIISSESNVIDYFLYSEKDHSPLIKDEEGVSLERISFSQPANNAENWRSANASAGYATPGYINSNSRPDILLEGDEVKITPEIFSAGSVGNDFVQVSYQFEESGLVANAKIYDQQGRAIKEIYNNETISYQGSFRWDGDCDNGTKARNGYYLVWFETFNSGGKVKTFRKRVIVASR